MWTQLDWQTAPARKTLELRCVDGLQASLVIHLFTIRLFLVVLSFGSDKISLLDRVHDFLQSRVIDFPKEPLGLQMETMLPWQPQVLGSSTSYQPGKQIELPQTYQDHRINDQSL